MDQSIEFSNWTSRDAYVTTKRADLIAIVFVLAVLVAVAGRFV